MPGKPAGEKVIATNRRAWHDYDIEERFEAGMELTGAEVKSLRQGWAELREAYADLDGNQLWIYQLHIRPYQSSPYAAAPQRRRRLLVHRRELERLLGAISRKGRTIVPLRLYFSPRGWAKVELAVAHGRSQADRRESVKKRDDERRMRRARMG